MSDFTRYELVYASGKVESSDIIHLYELTAHVNGRWEIYKLVTSKMTDDVRVNGRIFCYDEIQEIKKDRKRGLGIESLKSKYQCGAGTLKKIFGY